MNSCMGIHSKRGYKQLYSEIIYNLLDMLSKYSFNSLTKIIYF